MTEHTATINGVVLTEAQLREGLKQIEEANRRPLKTVGSKEYKEFRRAAKAVGLPEGVAPRNFCEFAGKGLFLGDKYDNRTWKVVTDSDNAKVLIWEDQ